MNESNLHKGLPNDGTPPIHIPPVGDSWMKMEERLNEAMPLQPDISGTAFPENTGTTEQTTMENNVGNALPAISRIIKISGSLVVMAVITTIVTWQVMTYSTKHHQSQTSSLQEQRSFPPDKSSTTAPGNANIGTAEIQNTIPSELSTSDKESPGSTSHTSAQNGVLDKPVNDRKEVGERNGNKVESTINSSDAQSAGVGKTMGGEMDIEGLNGTGGGAEPGLSMNTGAKLHVGRNVKSDRALNMPDRRVNAADNSNKASRLADDKIANSVADPSTAINTNDKHLSTSSGAAVPTSLLMSLPAYQTPANRRISAALQAPPTLTTQHQLGCPTGPRQRGYWQIMPQWTAQLPINGSLSWYKGPNGNSQLYKIPIPGIRAERTWLNAALSLDLNALATQAFNNKWYDTVPYLGSGTNIIFVSLIQTFGYSATLSYSHRVKDNWFAGVGAQAYYAHLAGIQRTYQYSLTNDTARLPQFFGDKTEIWKSIGRFQSNATAEIYYDHSKWQAAFRTTIPVYFQRLEPISDPIKPKLQLELLFRWKIISPKY
ncbi:hypothetical protein [Chitinophaga sp. sic0106]|uniref:hypothetical protein n=1 Tax=Chitinophaga sp. sic0106 TaxID=2854785 RepID=UPI001C44C68A|nr:hypothetical protein [Chitinophaga sp. sic0106]MBV7531596.1 hypothetical protein [Chitinophaga sp. sic0106]